MFFAQVFTGDIAMKKLILTIVMFIFFLVLAFPATGDTAYRILLKNGGELTTFKYWSEDNQIKFYIYGGIVGISKDSIRKIEKIASENIIYKKSQRHQKAAKISPETNDGKNQKIEDKIDITYYKEKKSQLETELKRALDRVREAAKNNDSEAREQAREEAKEISAKMYDLTAELIKKNNGKMPEGWWEKQ